MGTTLYLLRQHPDRISPSLFRGGEVETEVVFLDQGFSTPPYSVIGTVISDKKMTMSHSNPSLTYEDLVKKIFSSERVVVI